MKFVDGFMVHSGYPTREYIDSAVTHVHLRQGVLGIKVKIMLPHDPTGKSGPKKPLPDQVNEICQGHIDTLHITRHIVPYTEVVLILKG